MNILKNNKFSKPSKAFYTIVGIILTLFFAGWLFLILLASPLSFLNDVTKNNNEFESDDNSNNFHETVSYNNYIDTPQDKIDYDYTEKPYYAGTIPATSTPFTFTKYEKVKYTSKELSSCEYVVYADNQHIDIYKKLDRVSIQILSMQVPNQLHYVKTVCDSDNNLIVFTNLGIGEDFDDSSLSVEVLTQIYKFDVKQNILTKLHEGTSYTGSLSYLEAATPENIYLWESYYEGANSLIRYNIADKTFYDLSDELGFWSNGSSELSPDKTYLAFTALSEIGDVTINRLSFFNIKTGQLIHSKLTSHANGEWVQGIDYFKDLKWSDDSKSVTVAIDDEGADESYKIDMKNIFIQGLLRDGIIFLAEKGTFKVGIDGNIVQ